MDLIKKNSFESQNEISIFESLVIITWVYLGHRLSFLHPDELEAQ